MPTYDVQCADAFDWLRAQDSESVDLIVTDPPYESLEKYRSPTSRLTSWFPVLPNAAFPEFFSEAYRILRPNSHLYFLCDSETMFAVKPMGEAAGFKFWKPLIWDKVHIGMGYHYRNSYEVALFFEKGKRKLNDLGIRDVLPHPRIVRARYPTEKPVPLLTVLIQQSTLPGEVVADPFCGSGSTGVAALSCDRLFAGCDLSPDAVTLTRSRLAQVQAHDEPS